MKAKKESQLVRISPTFVIRRTPNTQKQFFLKIKLTIQSTLTILF